MQFLYTSKKIDPAAACRRAGTVFSFVHAAAGLLKWFTCQTLSGPLPQSGSPAREARGAATAALNQVLTHAYRTARAGALVKVTKMAPACTPVAGLCQWYTADSKLLEAASARLFPLVIYLYKYLKFCTCRQIKARPIIFYDCSCFDGLIFCRTESEYVGLRRTLTD